jgi:3'-phosphoadenosine 5'-phosphosulfate sulfotransferase
MALSELQQQAVQLIVLDRWNPEKCGEKVARTLDVNRSTVAAWRKKPEFKEALQEELERDRKNFDNVPLAWRKNRVLALEEIYNKIEDRRVALKLKVLREIREEVGDNRLQVEHTVEVKNLNVPPRADSYEEWLKQNERMVEANYTVEESAQ